jgi:hypothetical protein
MTTQELNEPAAPEVKSKSRLYIGIIILILALAMPIWGSLLVSLLGLPPGISTILIGLSVAGGPDLLLLLAAAVMGKDSLNQLLGKIGHWFKRNFKLSENVSKSRYRIGLILFWGSILIRWALGFIRVQPIPPKGDLDWGLYILLAFEVVLVISVFVLGADYWDKLGSLFRWNTRVVTVDESTD